MKKYTSWLRRGLFFLFVLSSLIWSSCSGEPSGQMSLPDSITTDKADRFKVGKIFIDSRSTSAAFLVLRSVENDVVGEVIQANQLPLGRQDELTVTLKDTYRLSPGKQKIQITVYLDDNKNGKPDDSDSIAGGGAMQKVVVVDFVNDSLQMVIALLASTSSSVASEFLIGEVYIPTTEAKGAFALLFADKDGKPGELLETQPIAAGGKRNVNMKLTYPRKLLSGKQTFHVAIYLDKNGNGTYEDSDPVAKDGTQKIEVELTTTRYENEVTFVSKIHTLYPEEFVVGSVLLATDGKVRRYMVVRLVENGKPGKTLGVNEWRFEGKEHEMKVKLKYPLTQEKQQIHMGIYRNLSGKGWTEENWDQKAELSTDRDGNPFEVVLDVTFESSVEDTNAEYYAQTCGNSEVGENYVKNKTKLKMDCRCTNNRILDPTVTYCNGKSYETAHFTVGNGPSFRTMKARMSPGDVWPERDEIIFGLDRGAVNTGKVRKRFTIVALNYKTNTRRFVSGEMQDAKQGEFVVGDGPLGEEVTHLRRGPDGKAYAYSNAEGGWIFRVDVETGDREVVWKWDDSNYGQCPNGVKPKGDPDWKLQDSIPGPYQLGIDGRGFTIAPDGSFYLPTTANGSPRPGYAVIRISKDAKTCKVISTSGAAERNAYFGGIGKGFDIKGPIGSMIWHNNKLLTISWAGDLLEIDPDTGDRTRIAGNGIQGSGSVPVSWRMFVDPNTKLLMLTGILPPNNPGVIGVDLSSGKVWSFLCMNHDPTNTYTSGCIRGPQSTLFISYMPGYILPDGMYLGGAASTGFNHYEISTGNSYILNY